MEVVVVAAEVDFEDVQELCDEMKVLASAEGGTIAFTVLAADRMSGRTVAEVSAAMMRGAHLFALLTPALVRDKRCILNLQYLVQRHADYSNAFGNFFHPVFYDDRKARRWYLPVYFQGWKGIPWFSRERKLRSAVLQILAC